MFVSAGSGLEACLRQAELEIIAGEHGRQRNNPYP